MPARPRLTYANVVATLALFLALGGGAAFAAGRINSGDIANGAIKTADIHQRAITSGKLGIGAVRGNQIAAGTLSSSQIKPESIAPASLAVPVVLSVRGAGGPMDLPNTGTVEYPLGIDGWTQPPGQVDLIAVGGTATLAYNGVGAPPSCNAIVVLELNGRVFSDVRINTGSTSPTAVPIEIPVSVAVDAETARTNTLSAEIEAGSGCAAGSKIDSLRVRVIGIG
jgi:hypothetical protein